LKNNVPKRKVMLSVLAGAAAGYFVLHPYSMFAYGIYGKFHAALGAGESAFAAFKPEMLHMGIPYAVLGAVGGLFFGLWLEAERRKDEMERRALALDTLRQLIVTLSHYLLNASTVIGGFASRAMKKEDNPDIAKALTVIRDEAGSIEGVVASLQSLETVVTERYTNEGETLMIDIHEKLERKLREQADKRRDAA